MIIGLMGSSALFLLLAWLAACIAASWLSERKGYGEKAGLATALLLSVVGTLVWLVIPARADSAWKRYGPTGRTPRSG